MALDDALWLPFTSIRAFEKSPRIIGHAEGMYFRDKDGKALLDAASGLWCVNAGHGRKEIAEAVSRQLLDLDYAPGFGFSHEGAYAAAEAIKALLPKGFGSVFFTNSGSESADTALKIALAYHNAKGEPRRNRLVGRIRGYHGVNFGGMSVGGLPRNKRQFGPMLPNVDHLRDTHDPARNAFSRGQPDHGAELADDLKRVIATWGADAIAAVIVEPLAGSAGVLVPPKGYLERLRAICDRHGILLIFDEVITGFGRLGHAFAAERYGVTPDLITFAKGVTSGSVPMGGVIAREHVYDAFMHGPEQTIELFHGYTYSAHPLACAAGLAALDLYRDEQLFERARALEPQFADAAMALKDLPGVLDIRTLGLTAGIDLASRPGAVGARAYAAMDRAFGEEGLMIRITGDTIALCPPLIASEAQIGEIFDKVARVIRAVM